MKKYVFGDTAVYFAECPLEGHEGKSVVGLALYPKGWDVQTEKLRLDSLIQVAFTGDESLVDYTRGVTMLNRESVLVHIVKQEADGRGVVTYLSDGAGNDYIHTLLYDGATGVFTAFVRYENHTGRARTLEFLASASLGGIFALSNGGASTCGLKLHRMTSAWSRECRLQSLPFSAIGMEHSWARYGVKVERWGQLGSMPNRGYYPFAAVEDEDAGVVWGFTLEAPYSWQLQLYEEKESATLSGGLADYEYGHWRKTVPDGGSFQTHRAYLTLQKSLDAVCNAFVREADARLCVPSSEEDMPVMFNEYCTTWGNPSPENIKNILGAICDFPIRYFIIDCGWYKPLEKHWCNAIGDWTENKELFPNGISAVVKEINAAGMKAGIWFEYENTGRDSDVFYRENMHLTRDGRVITAKNRRFLDLRKGEVQSYLREKVIKQLKENGFEYIKIDYNDAYGIGCDGAESVGEGGRLVAEESISFLDTLAHEVDGLIIENCASGGSRIEPLRMSKVSMCSFSDAHECAEIPLVAANLSRVIPARQMQIWAVLRENDTDERTVYSLCAAMIGRICLSGDVLRLTPEKKALIREGLDFYAAVKDIVRYGDVVKIENTVEYYREPVGYQIFQKEYAGRRLTIVHRLKGVAPVYINTAGYRLVRAYTRTLYEASEGIITVGGGEFCAAAFLEERRI